MSDLSSSVTSAIIKNQVPNLLKNVKTQTRILMFYCNQFGYAINYTRQNRGRLTAKIQLVVIMALYKFWTFFINKILSPCGATAKIRFICQHLNQRTIYKTILKPSSNWSLFKLIISD